MSLESALNDHSDYRSDQPSARDPRDPNATKAMARPATTRAIGMRREGSPERRRRRAIGFTAALGRGAVGLTLDMPLAESERAHARSGHGFESGGRRCRITPIRVTPALLAASRREGHAAGLRHLVGVNVGHRTLKMGSGRSATRSGSMSGASRTTGSSVAFAREVRCRDQGRGRHDLLHRQQTKRSRVSAAQ